MAALLVLLVPLVIFGILGLFVRKLCKTTKKRLIAMAALLVVFCVVIIGLHVLLFVFATSQSSAMMEIDDERWFNAETVVSVNFSEATPLRGPCPKPGSPDFDQQVRSKQCSIIFVCGGGNSYLFVGWETKNRPRQVGTNLVGAVQDINARVGSLHGSNSTFFAHGNCFDPVAYFHGSGPNLGNDGPQQAASQPTNIPSTQQIDNDVAARLKPITDILQRPYTPLPEVPIPDQLWKDLGVTPTDEQRKEKGANSLRLSDGQLPELLVEDLDPGLCGSGQGCPWSIYGLRGEVTKDSSVILKYKALLESTGGGVYVLDSVANGYRDLLIDSGYGGSVLKFDGTSYVVTECFSHEYKTLDVVQLTNCQ